MTKKRGKNIAASVHERLLNKSRETGCPFAELLQYFAMERFIYRLSSIKTRQEFHLERRIDWQSETIERF